ncbi:GTP-binding ADP-ribosylation factor-like protein [Trachipleistophora hominis]|uniref:GTP-binding ADP-ribosylation factor-like protein n=1 Tax=Trachipleistophora hominis TaxID=72359 RepID=L7JZP7_TRAHO|nr:GTP-binding ADP-ribosylation factor-like protein [Trachipleistophora hominis]
MVSTRRRNRGLCAGIKRRFRQLYEYFFVKNLKVAFIGLSDSGKSSFVSPLFENEFLQDMNSPEVRIHEKKMDNIKVLIYDIPGDPSSISKWDHYYKKSDVIIFFLNSTADEETRKKSKNELHSLLYRNMWMRKNLLILGTKNDLPDSMSCKDIILALDLMTIGDREVACYSISNKNLVNIDLVREWIVEQAALVRETRWN